ncbi:hypothetical protein FRC08_001705 [Ceratobasidium sp. 394]|nr:hypothetical protein FRC08_001705 [Ceratobasidium sp. 394]
MMDTDSVEQLPRYRGRRPINILLVANPDHENDSSLQVPETPPRHQSGPASASTSSRVPADPPLTSPASGSGNSPRLNLNPPSFTLNHELLPLDRAVTTRLNRVTPDSEPIVEDGVNLPGFRVASTRSHHARRASDSTLAMQSPNTNRSFSPSPRQALSVSHTPSERVIVSVTHDAQKYITVDITDHMSEARAIRKCLLSKLAIPEDHRSNFAIYRTTLDKFTSGNYLGDDQLLIDCHGFGDSKGSLKFSVQRVGASPRPRPLPPLPSSAQPVQPLRVGSNVSPTSSETGSRENKVSGSLQVDTSGRNDQSAPGYEADEPVGSVPVPQPKATVEIGRTMPPANIIQHLVLHGCRDITADLNLSSCSEYPIANGGFGEVYRGQLGNGTRVAIKCMRVFECPDVGEQQQKYLKRAAREIYTWSKLQHPHVLRLLGLVVYRDRISMVSPWIESGAVRYYLIRTPEVNRPQMCTQIASALLYLHESGVIHGDLKGDNVLVSDAGEALITDFGNAILQEHTLQFTSSTTGTHLSTRWTAPELLEGGKRSFAADIFALGMEVITGNVPYAGMNEMAVMYAIGRSQHPKRSEAHISSTSKYGNMLWSLLEECWDLDPGTRPAAVAVRDKMRIIGPNDLVAQ